MGQGNGESFWHCNSYDQTCNRGTVHFIFMGRWNDYLWPLIAIVDEDKMTLPLALNFFNSSLLTDYCTSMSAGVLVMIPIIIIYFIFQKQFIEGITMTGIK